MKKGKPRLSVIIPTKNEAKLLPLCLRSLARQRTKIPYEIIIVDTKSTDGTPRIARSFGAHVIQEPRKGKVFAFRRGAAQARGEILCFTEADCILPPNWIDTIAEYLDEHPKAVAIMGEYTYHDSTPFYNFLARTFHPIARWVTRVGFGHHLLRASNFAIRKRAYKKVGGFSAHVPELYDVELARRLAKHGEIHYVAAMRNQTSDRRLRGRGLRFLTEFIPTFLTIIILRRKLAQQTYQDIR